MSSICTVSKLASLPESASKFVLDNSADGTEQEANVFGGILSNTNYVWVANGPLLEVYNTKQGHKITAWTFGYIMKDFSTKIVCVEEITPLDGSPPLLAIGLENQIGGMVVIFHFCSSKVLRAIQIPNKVSSIHVINSGTERQTLDSELSHFDGILAVGVQGGDVYLLDLCYNAIRNDFTSYEPKDETDPCFIELITVEEMGQLSKLKERCNVTNVHLGIHINATPNASIPHFVLRGPKGNDLLYVNKSEAAVSAMKYSPNLCSLLVGYNFGAFQIWNLSAMKLLYTNPVIDEDPISITHFGVQEPSDDPRAYCYFWAVYGNQEPFHKGYPLACLYTIVYESRKCIKEHGYVYEGFQNCNLIFRMQLNSFDLRKPKVDGAYCLSLNVINKTVTKCKTKTNDAHEESLALASIVWNTWNNEEISTYLCIFDLNQWYKEQLPSTPSSNYRTYMTVTCISDYYNSEREERFPVINARICPKSVFQHSGIHRLEEHYHPTSLGYKCYVLTLRDIGLVQIRSQQKVLLRDLEMGGPLVLIKPAELYQKAIQAGLVPIFTEGIPHEAINIDYQRQFLLSVALEQQLIGFLKKCASSWANGSFSSVGCSFDFLLNWAWQRTTILKNNADVLCASLFDFSEQILDTNNHNLLIQCKRQLINMSNIFKFINENLKAHLPNLEALEQQVRVLDIIATYFDVLLWLIYIGILPENSVQFDSDKKDEHVPYPADYLLEYYDNRRAALKTTSGPDQSILFIDNMVELDCGGTELSRQWHTESEYVSHIYPPTSIQSLLRTYLVQNCDMKYKHLLLMYVFLDVASVLDENVYKDAITNLIRFPSLYKIGPSLLKITQGFWHLDHEAFPTAVHLFLDSAVLPGDLKKWHHNIILKSLQVQEQYKLALLYLEVRRPPLLDVEDINLGISLYVSNRMLDQALYFQRSHRKSSKDDSLILYFFQECNRTDQIFKVLDKKLQQNEENLFIKYLQDINHPKREEFLVAYYTQHSRFMELFELHKRSKNRPYEQGLIGQSNLSLTENTVKLMRSLVPPITLDLMNMVQKEKSTMWKTVERPKPLSVFIHNNEEKINYKSTMIYASMAKARETWTQPCLDTSNNKVSTEETPFLKTPQAFLHKKKIETPIIYPDVIESKRKHAFDQAPTPAKRQKIGRDEIHSTSFSSNLSLALDTPVVKRKNARRRSSSETQNEKLTPYTPQSILKVNKKQLTRERISPDPPREYSKTPEILEVSGIHAFSENDADSTGSTKSEAKKRLSTFGITPRKAIVRTPIVRFLESKSPQSMSDGSATSSPTDFMKNSFDNSSLKKVSANLFHGEDLQENEEVDDRSVILVTADVHSSGETDYFSPANSLASITSSANTTTNENAEEHSDSENIALSSRKPIKDSFELQRNVKRIQEQEVSIPVSPRRSSLRLMKKRDDQSRETTPERTIISDLKVMEKETVSPVQEEFIGITIPKLTGRRSLSRRVLENNAAKTVLSPRRSVRKSVVPDGSTVSIETSFSKTETIITREKDEDSGETETIVLSKTESKDAYSKEKDLESGETKVLHTSEESKQRKVGRYSVDWSVFKIASIETPDTLNETELFPPGGGKVTSVFIQKGDKLVCMDDGKEQNVEPEETETTPERKGSPVIDVDDDQNLNTVSEIMDTDDVEFVKSPEETNQAGKDDGVIEISHTEIEEVQVHHEEIQDHHGEIEDHHEEIQEHHEEIQEHHEEFQDHHEEIQEHHEEIQDHNEQIQEHQEEVQDQHEEGNQQSEEQSNEDTADQPKPKRGRYSVDWSVFPNANLNIPKQLNETTDLSFTGVRVTSVFVQKGQHMYPLIEDNTDKDSGEQRIETANIDRPIETSAETWERFEDSIICLNDTEPPEKQNEPPPIVVEETQEIIDCDLTGPTQSSPSKDEKEPQEVIQIDSSSGTEIDILEKNISSQEVISHISEPSEFTVSETISPLEANVFDVEDTTSTNDPLVAFVEKDEPLQTGTTLIVHDDYHHKEVTETPSESAGLQFEEVHQEFNLELEVQDSNESMGNISSVFKNESSNILDQAFINAQPEKSTQKSIESKDACIGEDQKPAKRTRSSSTQSETRSTTPARRRSTRFASLDVSVQTTPVTPTRKRRLSKNIEPLEDATQTPQDEVKVAAKRNLRSRSFAGESPAVERPATPKRRPRSVSSSSNKETQCETDAPKLRWNLRSRSTSVDEDSSDDLAAHKLNIKKTLSIHSLPTIQETYGPSPLKKSKNSDTKMRQAKSEMEVEISPSDSIYSNIRRLTRHQKSMLDKILDESEQLSSTVNDFSEDSVIENRGPDLPKMDPIVLLERDSFQGKTDPDEEAILQRSATSSIASRSEVSRPRSQSVSSAGSGPRTRKRSPNPEETNKVKTKESSQDEQRSTRSRRMSVSSEKSGTTSTRKTKTKEKDTAETSVLENIKTEEEQQTTKKRGRPSKHQ